MTVKLSAETVAKTCYKLLFDFYETSDVKIVQEPVVAIIIKALEQFAAEKVKEAHNEGFCLGVEAEKELCKHPIYCRGCNNCGEEGCCGPHDNYPSGTIINNHRKDAISEVLEEANDEIRSYIFANGLPVKLLELTDKIDALKDKKI